MDLPLVEPPPSSASFVHGIMWEILMWIGYRESILDARERAKARSLLDPSDPSDVKAFSPPISNLEFGQPISVF